MLTGTLRLTGILIVILGLGYLADQALAHWDSLPWDRRVIEQHETVNVQHQTHSFQGPCNHD